MRSLDGLDDLRLDVGTTVEAVGAAAGEVGRVAEEGAVLLLVETRTVETEGGRAGAERGSADARGRLRVRASDIEVDLGGDLGLLSPSARFGESLDDPLGLICELEES